MIRLRPVFARRLSLHGRFTGNRWLVRLLGIWLALAVPAHAQAGIVLNATRVIYQGTDREAGLTVQNTGAADILVQAWLDAEEGAVDPHPPFVVTPPLSRVSGQGRQMLRIIHDGSQMPQGRESVYWLSVQEVPQAAGENALQVAVRQRIKLFYRPSGLKDDPRLSSERLTWQWLSGSALRVVNAGPYHVSIADLQASGGARLSKGGWMLAPGQNVELPLSPGDGRAPLALRFTNVNDYGGQETYHLQLRQGETANAVRLTEG